MHKWFENKVIKEKREKIAELIKALAIKSSHGQKVNFPVLYLLA